MFSPESGFGCISLKGTSRPTSLQHKQELLPQPSCTKKPAKVMLGARSSAHLDPISLGDVQRQTGQDK